MAGFGFVQAVHVHDALAGQSSPASHCSVCVAAHNAVLITPSQCCAGAGGRGGAAGSQRAATGIAAAGCSVLHSSSPAKPLIHAAFPLTIAPRLIHAARGQSVFGRPLPSVVGHSSRTEAGNSFWRFGCWVVSPRRMARNQICRRDPPGTHFAWMRALAACAIALSLSTALFAADGTAAAGGSAAAIEGLVADPSGAIVPGATVEIQNPVSQLDRKTTTDGGRTVSAFPTFR